MKCSCLRFAILPTTPNNHTKPELLKFTMCHKEGPFLYEAQAQINNYEQ